MAKRAFEVTKRCGCDEPDACTHHWWLRVHAGGKRQRIDLTETYGLAVPMTREDVEPHAARAKHEARKGLIVNGRHVHAPTGDTRLTVGDVADRYVAARGGKHYYVAALRASEVPAASGGTVKLEAKPIDEVTTADVKHAVKIWCARKRTLAGAQRGAVAERHFKQSARHLFNWAIEEGYATRTPFKSPQGVNLIHVKATKGRKRRLEPGEEQRILDAADPYIADFFTAMLETGCRPGELRLLQWSEVRGEEIVILKEKAKDREERRIPIMPTLRQILDCRRKGPDGHDLPADAYVFGDETGAMIPKRRLCGRWLDTYKRAKVRDLHLHDLRREAASQLLEFGAKLHEVRDALGHSSTTMTSTYLSVNSLTKAYRQRHAQRARKSMRLARVGQSNSAESRAAGSS